MCERDPRARARGSRARTPNIIRGLVVECRVYDGAKALVGAEAGLPDNPDAGFAVVSQ